MPGESVPLGGLVDPRRSAGRSAEDLAAAAPWSGSLPADGQAHVSQWAVRLGCEWLQERIAEDPTILGLGDLEVKDLERVQHRSARYKARWGLYRIQVTDEDLAANHDLLKELIALARDNYSA